MVLNLIAFSSSLQKQGLSLHSHEALLGELEKYFSINIIDYQDISKLTPDDFSIIFILTGGTERLIIQHFESFPRPIVLLADGLQNSLAATLEVSSWIRNRGIKSEILHGDYQEIVKRIFILYTNSKAQRTLSNTRIGIIGGSAPWLVASNVDYLLARRRWGVTYMDIPLERIYEYFYQITDDAVGQDAANFASRALACREATPEDLIKAMRFYKAIKQVVEEEKLNALTLSCFKVTEDIGTTGCLALSLLNDEGITAGCEGDTQSIFTQVAIKALTGKPSFMANPSMINVHTNEIVLGHCTIGTAQTEQFIIRNHYETESGIAIQGILPTGDVTLVKCGGECLDEYYLSTGRLTENTNYINLCRTQVRIQLDSPVSYFFRNPIGNHHIMVKDNYQTVLDDFFQSNKCKHIE